MRSRTLGAFPVVIDLESSTVEEVAKVLDGADVAVFAAGAGPGSSIERKDSVDRAAAVLLADAAEKAGVRRFIQISAMGAGDEIPETPTRFLPPTCKRRRQRRKT